MSDLAKQPSELVFRVWVQPEIEKRYSAKWYSKLEILPKHQPANIDYTKQPSQLDIWSWIQPEAEAINFAKQPSELDFGPRVQHRLEGVTLPGSCQTVSILLDFWSCLQSEHCRSDLSKQSWKLGIWRWVQPELGTGVLTKHDWKLDVWCVSGSIRGWGLVTLPSSLQSLNFGSKLNKGLPHVMLPSELLDWTSFRRFKRSLERKALGVGRQPQLHFLYWLWQEFERGVLPQEFAKQVFLRWVQPGLGGHRHSQAVSKPDFWRWVRPELAGSDLA